MKKTCIVFLFFVISILIPSPLSAASIHLEPASITIQKGGTFQINVKGDAMIDPVAGVEILLHYDPTLIEIPVDSNNKYAITPAAFFSKADSTVSNGTIHISGVQENKDAVQPANSTLATITLRTLKEGTTPFELECLGSQSSSKILKQDTAFTNVLDCALTNQRNTTSITIIPQSTNVLGASTRNKPNMLMNYSLGVVSVITVFSVGLFLLALSSKKTS